MPVRSRGAARAFDRGKTLFSESLTTVNMNAYLAVQRVCTLTLCLGVLGRDVGRPKSAAHICHFT